MHFDIDEMFMDFWTLILSCVVVLTQHIVRPLRWNQILLPWSPKQDRNIWVCLWKLGIHLNSYFNGEYQNRTAQGGGGSFKNRKPIGEVGCCESGMAERSHWWTERCLRSPLFLSLSLFFSLFLYLSLIIYLPTYWSICLPIYLSVYLSPYLSIYLPIYLAV